MNNFLTSRINREGYFKSIVFSFFVSAFLIILVPLAMFTGAGTLGLGQIPFQLVLLVLFLLVSILTVKRLRDMNLSGFFVLIVIGVLSLSFYLLSEIAYFLVVLFTSLFILSVVPGTKGNNQYGPDPLDTSTQIVQQEGNTQ